MNILITGSNGVIGTRLTKFLADRSYGVYGIDLTHTDQPESEYRRLDCRDYSHLERLFSDYKFDMVYHCAAEFGRHNGDRYSDQLWTTNILGLKNMIAMQELHKFKMVFFSSSEVYGDWHGEMSENVMVENEVRQLNDYALTKWIGEQLVNRSAVEHGTESVIVRLFNTYGPGEPYTPYRSVNCRFAHHAIHGLPIVVYKGHWRTSTYIDDTVRTLANITDNWYPGEVFNIGGTRIHSIEELAEITWRISGANPKLITYADPEPNTTMVKRVNIDKAIRLLDHECAVDLEEGIQMTVDWMRQRYGTV